MLRFSMAGESEDSRRHYWYFPVVDEDGELVLGECLAKTFDASGYHNAEVSASDPENLLRGWTTAGLQGYTRVGLILFREDDEMKPLPETARVYWLKSETINSSDDLNYVRIPRFESLDRIELQPQWLKYRR